MHTIRSALRACEAIITPFTPRLIGCGEIFVSVYAEELHQNRVFRHDCPSFWQ
jgi:hypothetical protein